MIIKARNPKPIPKEGMEKLTLTRTGLQKNQELRRCGAVATDPTATVVISVKNPHVVRSIWALTGNLGLIECSAGRLGRDCNTGINLDCEDLSKWDFPSADDPTEA